MNDDLIKSIGGLSKAFTKLSEQISDSGLDKLQKLVKEELRNRKLINDELYEMIDTSRELEDTLKDLDEMQRKAIKSINKLQLEQGKSYAEAKKIVAKQLKMAEKRLDLYLDEVPVVRRLVEEQLKNVTGLERLKKGYDHLSGSVKEQIKYWTSLTGSMILFKKGLVTSYEQMVKFTNKGMLGAFTTINTEALKLRLLPEEFEEIINKNRDVVNMLGGGAAGISKLADQISAGAEGLEYLGRDRMKASAQFMSLSKTLGMGAKNGSMFNKQFTQFQGAFGDTFEEYGKLYESLSQEEVFRSRLNSLNETQIKQEVREMMVRTQNLKLMGMTNEQIAEMGRRADDLFNPRKNNIADRLKGAALAKMQVTQMVSLLSSRKETMGLAQNLQANQGTLFDLYDAQGRGDINAARRIEGSEAGARAMQAFGSGMGAVGDRSRFDQLTAQSIFALGQYDKSGLLDNNYANAMNVATAKTQGRDQLTGGRGGELLANSERLAKASGTIAEHFDKISVVINQISSALGNPFVQLAGAVLGVSVAFRLLSGVVKFAASGFKMMGGGVEFLKGIFSKLASSPIGKMLGFGAAAAAGTALFDNASTSTEDYEKRFGISAGNSFLGHMGLRTLGFASDLGNAATFGLAGKFYRDKQGGSSSPINSAGAGTAQSPAGGKNLPRNIRNNNPGNLEYNSYTRSLGAIGSDGRFAIFPDYATGRKAMETMLFSGKGYRDLSLTQAISRYAPSSENNTSAYQSTILKQVGANKRMGDYSPQERQTILNAMQVHEGGPAAALYLPGSNGQNPMVSELSKQTDLLAQIAASTGNRSRFTTDPSSFPQPTSATLNAPGS